jgi:hypothetical protein
MCGEGDGGEGEKCRSGKDDGEGFADESVEVENEEGR